MKNLTTIAGAIVLPIAGFLGGVEYQKQNQSFRQRIYQGVNTTPVHEGKYTNHTKCLGITLTGNVINTSDIGMILRTQSGRSVAFDRDYFDDFFWQSLIVKSEKDKSKITIYTSKYGKSFARPDIISLGTMLYDLRNQ
jgi:hypothetical protein